MKPSLFILVEFLAVFGNISANSFGISNFKVGRNQQPISENWINDTINEKASHLKKYDPISIKHLEGEILRHSYLFENAVIRGFSNIYASRIKMTGIFTWYLDLVLEAPHITGSVECWKVDSELFYGDGDAKFEINNTKLTVKAAIGIFNWNVKEINVIPHIGQANVIVTGVYNDEELSRNLTDTFNYVLNDYVNNNRKFHNFLSKVAYDLVKKS